jgi:hypothetical protein
MSFSPGFLQLEPRRSAATGALALALALAGGCDTSIQAVAGWPDDAGTSGDGDVVGAGTKLPCDVAQVLSKRCWSCHGPVPTGGATLTLATRDDILMMSPSFPGQTYAQRIVTRMTQGTMPPGGGASQADIKVFSDWIAAGTPEGDCGGSGSDGGMSMPDPLNAAPTCTSSSTAVYTKRESIDMNPGYACITCHKQNSGPNLLVGGTVYPSGHEPDLCRGGPQDGNSATVVISDMSGKDVKTLYVSPNTGNFNWRAFGGLPQPYKARVEYNGWTRAMSTPQTDGDCNGCHTATGANNAPGRITLPYM